VRDGTKGDRPRDIMIENDVQRDVLSRAKQAADKKTDFLGIRGKSVEQKIRHLYHVLEKCGVTLADNDISAHGLRHQYIHRQFKKLSGGIEPPIRGGDISQIPEDTFRLVCRQLIEAVGHSKPQKVSAYSGSLQRKKSGSSSDELSQDVMLVCHQIMVG
jgi:integrase